MNKEIIVLLHVMLAAFLAGVIGLERETFHKPAGLRTNMIVGGASALLISLGEIIVVFFNEQ
jgi:putative Mg2+ transporter-C (MgtC) family protein